MPYPGMVTGYMCRHQIWISEPSAIRGESDLVPSAAEMRKEAPTLIGLLPEATRNQRKRNQRKE